MKQIVLLIAALGLVSHHAEVSAQVNPLAPTSAMDNLSDGAVPSASNNPALQRARGLQNPPGAPAGAPGAIPAGAGDAAEAIARVARPRVKAIIGERVFDAVSGEMLDDAQMMFIDEAERDALGLVDDGDIAKGDVTANDGIWTNVYTTRVHISPSNQRLKERLIKAIYTAEQLSPLEFYGYPILTTERHNPAPRSRSWKLIDDPRGEGKMMRQIETEKPLQIPKYREVEQRKDQKIAGQDGWALLFLDEYRVEKGDLKSEFYPVYIPLPPVPPMIAPPGEGSGWEPFPNPAGVEEVPGADNAIGKYGYKVKQPLPDIEGGGGGGANPYYDKRNAAALLRGSR